MSAGLFVANSTSIFLYIITTKVISNLFNSIQKVYVTGYLEVLVRVTLAQANLLAQFTVSNYVIVGCLLITLAIGYKF